MSGSLPPLTPKDKEYLDRKTLSHIEALTDIAYQLGRGRNATQSTVIVATIFGEQPATKVVAANPNARMRTILNTGFATAWFGFGPSVNADNGFPMQPGGGYEWPLGAVDTRALYVYSVDNTEVRVLEGS